MMSEDLRILQAIRLSLWGTGACEADEALFEEMKKHALVALAAPVLDRLALPTELRQRWQTAAYRQIAYNVNCRRAQAALPVTAPYVILKGTTAAKYYPHPECRALGDIDIMPRREDFDAVCQALLDAGYRENTVLPPNGVMRHRGFVQNRVEVEVHAYFARLNDPGRSRYLDDLIVRNIGETHELPDLVNGLVILEHISQHLEEGLGLRQIIDWMMFVRRCLPDAQWPDFHPMADAVGLEKLAVTSTRMCEIYLGLPKRAWCGAADEDLCARLMDYVLSCGNFGAKRETDSQVSERMLTMSRSPRAILLALHRNGLDNWEAARKHAVLRPFAAFYQVGRYVKKGLLRKGAVSRLTEEMRSVRRVNALLDALEVGQAAKGYAVYEDGEYKKKY